LVAAVGEQFGKGVYFADMASKSANYCFSSRDNNVGIMALSEVALGDGYACLHSKYMDKPPSGFHSTKGCGQTEPDPATAVLTEVRHRALSHICSWWYRRCWWRRLTILIARR
jgi:hypothetical protein